MLVNVEGTLFRGKVGDAVTIAVVPRNNTVVTGAAFRYDSAPLPVRQVQGHPGCDFTVVAGSRMFSAVALFGDNAPGARCDLCEEDDAGTLAPLDVTLSPSEPAQQIEIDGQAEVVPAAVAAAAPGPPAALPAKKARAARTRKAPKRVRAARKRKAPKKVRAARTRKAPKKPLRRRKPAARRRPRPAAGRRRKPVARKAGRSSRKRSTGRSRRRVGR
jgi:hypothetical protein